MNKKIRAILVLLLFVLLLSPIEVNATQPSYLYPLGIVVEIDHCDENVTNDVKYIVDVVVRKEELSEYDEVPHDYSIFPDELVYGDYVNLNNEWISLLLYSPYPEWENFSCSSTLFGYGDAIEYFGFTEYKIVVYESGKDPVVSKTYYTSNLASWDDPTGFKHIYNPVDQTFSLQGYEAEYIGGYNPGFFDPLMMFVVGLIVIVVFTFGIFESVIFLISRQGKKAVLISLGFNMTVVGIVTMQITEFLIPNNTQMLLLGVLWVIASIYIAKIVLLHRYAYRSYQVSVLFSIIFYIVYVLLVNGMW